MNEAKRSEANDGPPQCAEPLAYKELRATLERFVARRVGSEDVQDVLQEIFVRISRGLPELRDEDRLTAWVHQVARNTIADHHRRKFRRRETPSETAGDLLTTEEEEEGTAATELARVLRDFMQLLSPQSREALELAELEGLTQAQTAKRLRLSVPGMKSRIQRARAQLRALLDRCCHIEVDVRGRVVDYALRERPAQLPGCCSKSRNGP